LLDSLLPFLGQSGDVIIQLNGQVDPPFTVPVPIDGHSTMNGPSPGGTAGITAGMLADLL
jgi:hypothetical protein